MNDRDGGLGGTLQDVARDLQRQQRWNGLLLTAVIAGILILARWANDEPYARNYVYMAVLVAVLTIRGADMQLLRSLTRLATALAQSEARAGTGSPGAKSSPASEA